MTTTVTSNDLHSATLRKSNWSGIISPNSQHEIKVVHNAHPSQMAVDLPDLKLDHHNTVVEVAANREFTAKPVTKKYSR